MTEKEERRRKRERKKQNFGAPQRVISTVFHQTPTQRGCAKGKEDKEKEG